MKAGQLLGLVGYSGLATHPQLELFVRHGGVAIDPFIGLGRKDPCSAGPIPLWEAAVMEDLGYRPFDIYNVGFAGVVPDVEAVRRGEFREGALPALSEALVMWLEAFYVEPRDRLRIKVFTPDGDLLVNTDQMLKKRQARYFIYSGKKRSPGQPWAKGTYRGEVTLTRTVDDRAITQSATAEVEIR